MFRILLVATMVLLSGATRARPAADIPRFTPKLIIYLARGSANACGPGCDRWIAVEGQVDQDAASRIARFLEKVKDTQRPIYLHSPGGSVGQAYIIARLLRKRKAVARVGKTLVALCGSGSQIDDNCVRTKTGGGELIVTRNAVCNSACGYLFMGATNREVAPDAVMAIHNSRLILRLPPETPAIVTDRLMEKADREMASFVASMGINPEFTDLVRTVKFETPHVLTRSELFRFGIDTRAMAETEWTLERVGIEGAFVVKVAQTRIGDGSAFRTLQWRLYCEHREHARLVFVRGLDADDAGLASMSLTVGSEQPLVFRKFPSFTAKYEVWRDTLGPDGIKALLEAPRLQMSEVFTGPDGRTNASSLDIDSTGLAQSWAQLHVWCPAAPAQATIASPAAGSIPALPATASPAPMFAPAVSSAPAATPAH
ncbi:MAG TPA: hypothetical protein VMU69_05270 [Bradyrhizobium sp.]|nr:hypothetical protein [Bradyrhizobium sp.]